MLTPLQERIAEIVGGLPEARGFALNGAGGLLVRGLIDRQTRDLDYFTVPGEEEMLSALRDALERALDRAPLDHSRQRDLSTFVRIEVSDGDDRCEIDPAIDYRALPAEPSDYGPTLAVRELAANKVLALFDRAEARDFLDLVELTRHFELQGLLELAEGRGLRYGRIPRSSVVSPEVHVRRLRNHGGRIRTSPCHGGELAERPWSEPRTEAA